MATSMFRHGSAALAAAVFASACLTACGQIDVAQRIAGPLRQRIWHEAYGPWFAEFEVTGATAVCVVDVSRGAAFLVQPGTAVNRDYVWGDQFVAVNTERCERGSDQTSEPKLDHQVNRTF
jgi:hypothetical protein